MRRSSVAMTSILAAMVFPRRNDLRLSPEVPVLVLRAQVILDADARVPNDPPPPMDVNFYSTFGITFEERSWIFTGPSRVEHVSANAILRVERLVERMERTFRIHDWLRPSNR